MPAHHLSRSTLNPERLSRVGALISGHIAAGTLPGAVTLVMRDGQIAYQDIQGVGDIASATPLQTDSLFRIYSLTKIVTSVALLMLYEEGALDLNDPVARYLPAFDEQQVRTAEGKLVAAERPTSVYDLLRHCGGLDQQHALEKLLDSDHTLASFTSELATLPLAAQPGTQWIYGYSTDILARIIEVVSGSRFDTFLQERIFDPLEMVDTCFTPTAAQAKRLTTCYHYSADGKLSVQDDNSPSSRFRRTTPYLSGSAGLLSTPDDYMRFCAMLLGGGSLDEVRILGRKTVELMTCDHLPSDHPNLQIGTQSFRFGLGVSVVSDIARTRCLSSLGEFGWGGAAGTQVWINPEENMVAMIMIQVRADVPTGIMDVVKRLVYQALV